VGRIGKLRVAGLVYYGVLIVAVVVGVLVGGGTGTTIAAIGAGLLALTILGSVGPGVAARDSLRRRGRAYGPSLDDEDRGGRRS